MPPTTPGVQKGASQSEVRRHSDPYAVKRIALGSRSLCPCGTFVYKIASRAIYYSQSIALEEV
jgi:hypothetical protein